MLNMIYEICVIEHGQPYDNSLRNQQNSAFYILTIEKKQINV